MARIGYARVSTTDQNLDLQRNALRTAGCVRVFEDHGVSGAATRRDGLSAVLRCLKKGDVLVVWRLDRLGRSVRHLVDLVARLKRRQVGFCSITESIDTESAGGRMVFHVLAAPWPTNNARPHLRHSPEARAGWTSPTDTMSIRAP